MVRSVLFRHTAVSASGDVLCPRVDGDHFCAECPNPEPSAGIGTSVRNSPLLFSLAFLSPSFHEGTSVLPSEPERPTFSGVRSLYRFFFARSLDFHYCRQSLFA